PERVEDRVLLGELVLDVREPPVDEAVVVDRHQMGSQQKTSPERSSGKNELLSAGSMCSAIVCGVQPSLRWTLRIGRGWLKRKISFLREPKICPVTPFERSLARNTAKGAIFAALISLTRSTRCFSSGVSVGIVPTS